MAFDKTGTLTFGNSEVIAVENCGGAMAQDELFRFAASAEALSEHPLGKAVVQNYKKQHDELLLKAEDFSMLPGKGIRAVIGGREILAGNAALFAAYGAKLPTEMEQAAEQYLDKGATIIYLCVSGVPAGFLALADTLRPESAAMLRQIQTIGVQPVLLTGDTENAAYAIAGQLGIREVRASCLPEDKLNAIDGFQKNGHPVCMIGDGFNDAPALKKADVGIAMGGVGSDIAVDAADIALVDDRVEELPHLLSLSKRMMNTIKLNLTFSMALNFEAILLAITGVLNPVVGALVHNAGSVLVIINSALLLKWKKRG